ncbi:MAG: tRNA preQ1(34) S-adenosylmethionine ribosyltransferase-isomerase QueA [Verrucomicrobiota bacterium]
MKTADYQYFLPEELIARSPIEPRDHCRLMVIDRKTEAISHAHFYDLGQWISKEDLLVMNNTRVGKVRLRNDAEGTELLLLKPLSETEWTAIGRPANRIKPGMTLHFPSAHGQSAEATILETLPDGERKVRFNYPPPLEDVGRLPIPPYIEKSRKENHEALYQKEDEVGYQTVYASEPGSVAAPTAGLHFIDEMLNQFQHTFLTLDIGLGTFRPVQADDIEDHHMHKETYSIPENLKDKINQAKRTIAVGTTVCRVLESRPSLEPGPGETDIFIYPPFPFKRTDVLLTNFHLPGSTLLMLIAAFMGKELQEKAYDSAVKEKYRFFSYGDAMLIL